MSVEKKLLIEDAERRICEESIPRIVSCLEHLSEGEIWFRENENSNAIANLILHLDGNVRQWIFSGLLLEKDNRKRALEFSVRDGYAKKDLIKILDILAFEIKNKRALLENVDLSEEKTIQGIRENGVSILMHVVEHFSYHTGQIALITKKLKNQDLRFYGNGHLNDLNQ